MSLRNGSWPLAVCAGLLLLLSACTNTANMSPADRQAFEGCKAYLKARAAPYDQAVAEAKKLHRSGNHSEACRLERKAHKLLDESIRSFHSGRCDRLHDVAGAYISSKVRKLRVRLVNDRQALQQKINRDCAGY